jgi:polar amino acid transport system permease protein
MAAGPPDLTSGVAARPTSRLSIGGTGTRALAIAGLSTLAVFGVLVIVVVNAPGWPLVQASFFDSKVFDESWPRIFASFAVNVRLFLVAEVLVLVGGLALAILRSLPGPAFFPVRLLATVYVDVFRALPGVLVIFILGFGFAALGLPGVPTDPFFWAVVALTLIYSAYVSEVYRAGIESIHPSQTAAARSLGLSQWQSLRFVVLPQAVRRVIPPLLNDFIGLQKDTVLVSFVGVVEVFRQSQIRQAGSFNFTPYVATAIIFLALTIPLARITDRLVARDRSRGAASGGAAGGTSDVAAGGAPR